MGSSRVIHDASEPARGVLGADSPLRPLIEVSAESIAAQTNPINGAVIGQLIAMKDSGRTPLIIYDGQPGAEAIPARSVVDLHGAHIGKQVVVLFEAGRPGLPIVMGVLQDGENWPLDERPATVEVDADGRRMIVSAKQELVVRCGKASITLDRDGKVIIRGTHIVSHAEGVNRIRGGSVQLN